MNIIDITFGHILFFLLGFTIFLTYFFKIKYDYLKIKYKKLENKKVPFSEEEHKKEVEKLKNYNKKEVETLKNSISKLTKNNSELLTKYNNLKKYLGIVNKNEYGILKTKLADDNNYKFKVSCGFVVTQRGKNNVKIDIDIDDVRSYIGKYNTRIHAKKIKNILDGWYDINDPEIFWIEPDESVKREIYIDNILD